jgi:hypothetical protein
LNEHGIRIFVLQTGSLAMFSLAQLLIAVTSSLTLLAVSGTLVDTLAIYVLPEKSFYSGFKYPETPHVSELVKEQKRRSSLDSSAISAMQNSNIVSLGRWSGVIVVLLCICCWLTHSLLSIDEYTMVLNLFRCCSFPKAGAINFIGHVQSVKIDVSLTKVLLC